MAGIELPSGLPAGYREIWEALRAADEQSPSRHVLARQLGISTHTIQRILVDGNVPDLAATRNMRVLRAWVRIIARLGHTFGRDPRAWVEAAGAAWDDSVAAVVAEVLERVTGREAAMRADFGVDGVGEEPIPEVAGYEFPGEIRVGIVGGDTLGLAIGGSERCFLETYVARLLGAISPDCRVTITRSDDAALTARLREAVPGLDMVAGVPDTLVMRMEGLDAVGIPGLKMRLSAVCLRRRGQDTRPPGWLRAVSPDASMDNKYLVLGEGLAHRFLRGQCGIPAESLIVREPSRLEEAADTLVMESSLWESSMHLQRWVILVSEEETCEGVKRLLEGREDVRCDYSVERLAGAPQDFPAYQAAIALHARRREVRNLLKAATGLELFGGGAANTAAMYAEMLASGFMKRNLGNLINPSISNGPHILNDFAGSRGVFRDVLCRELVRAMDSAIAEVIGSRGLFRTPEAVTAQARYLAAQHARNLLPPAWYESLDRVAPRPVCEPGGDLLGIPARHCLSCSASLLDEAHRGVSDRYCRICSDESGALRPRAEVEGILARWFAKWHGGLDDRDALRQAKDFMERMPAWCNN
jgi:hypothetical protein